MWLERLAAERHAALSDMRLATTCLQTLRTKHHEEAEKLLFRFL